MLIPSLPASDNLYKFLALVGVTLIVVGALYPVTRREEVNNRIMQVNAEILHRNKRLEFLQADVQQQHATTQASGKATEETRELILQGVDVDAARAEVEQLKLQCTEWNRICYAGLLLGTFCALMGFWLWHTRIQQGQDRLLRYQLAAAESGQQGPSNG